MWSAVERRVVEQPEMLNAACFEVCISAAELRTCKWVSFLNNDGLQ